MDIFTRFKQAVKIRQILVDNEVFQLHYRVTALLLLGSAALVASKQHFGDPIDCITRDDVPNKIMDTYCWIHSTFSKNNAWNKTVGIDVPHPGVDKYTQGEERTYHKYYQWVYFVLFFQACCFYAPHLIWKMLESKLLVTLTLNFKNPLSLGKEEQKNDIKEIAKYITNRDHKRRQNYFYSFTLCEVMNFINVIMQVYLVDEFLGGTFTTYGLDVMNYIQLEQDDRIDPMVRVFPRMTKCTFFRFGASGDVQKYDALCILPLNIINEKIYVIMWFWFVFLAIITWLWLLYRLITFTRPEFRYEVLKRKTNHTNPVELRYVLSKLKTGDWFLLSMMSKNMDSQWYKILISTLAQRIKTIDSEKKANKRKILNSNKRIKSHADPIIAIEDTESELDDEESLTTSLESGNPDYTTRGGDSAVKSS